MVRIVSTDKAPKAIGPYSQAVVAGNTVYVSGQLPMDPATGSLVEGDIKAKADRVFGNIAEILNAAGTSVDNVVKVTVYVKDMANFAPINEVYATYFGSNKPARAFVQVAALPKDADVEADAIAYVESYVRTV